METKPVKYAFTARALYSALKEYGEQLFTLADKIYVVEYTLINLPQLKKESLDENSISHIIYKHWFNLISPPPFGLNEWKDELKILAKFQETDPDNICVVFDTLPELSFLNRIYANDELLCVSELGAYLK